NRAASEIALQSDVTAMTDVTGFGLLGHAYEMAAAGGVRLRIEAGTLPALPGALRYIGMGLTPGGLERNRKYLVGSSDGRARAVWPASVPADRLALALDPQTSGGLLMAIPETRLAELVAHGAQHDQHLWIVGEVVEGHGVEVVA
ncbi:MAG: AIR synthase-related protein, partial [Chloroflexota bacterium]|nr:AIR synthase-related protein [Chloroflexota bacterium]